MTNSDELINFLNNQLQERDWSQNRLAREAKLSPSQVSRIMNGQRPSPEIARAIGSAVGVSGEYILKLAGRLESVSGDLPKRLEEWQDIFKQATPGQREKLLKMARELLRIL